MKLYAWPLWLQGHCQQSAHYPSVTLRFVPLVLVDGSEQAAE
jgi:hypothetical protein